MLTVRQVPAAVGICLLMAGCAGPADGPAGDTLWSNWGEDEWYCRTERRDVELYVRAIGIGEPVLVLHGGWGGEHSYLTDLVRPHVRERRFVLYDQRGSLRSPAPAEAISLDAMLADIERIRGQLGRQTIDIVAHSMGTYLAMKYLESHPDRVGRLVLLAPHRPASDLPLLADGTRLDYDDAPATNDWVYREATWAEMREEGVAPQEGVPDTQMSDLAWTKQWRISFAGANLYDVSKWRQVRGGHVFYNPNVYAAIRDSVPQEWNFIPALSAHEKGVHVIIGDHDFVDFGARFWRWAESQAPTVELRLIERAGHNSWIDDPQAVAAALRAALGIGNP
ncbi:MAG TPA: alpha/beta fold hydrolase [Candidatus Polarisedimenticolaceae bacterium]|nr:alpha/beta fold hydrolase [Candidatus Polarisedimenticolaceae bacterium]